ncbi:MAG: hypothetical protein HY744_14080 [Deltaproteobacteria bacterium]|nr:hypothetical protein [Deltaproteobacteria bacterium]
MFKATVTLDEQGNVYVAGIFEGAIDLGAGLLVAEAGPEPVLTKYDRTGQLEWCASRRTPVAARLAELPQVVSSLGQREAFAALDLGAVPPTRDTLRPVAFDACESGARATRPSAGRATGVRRSVGAAAMLGTLLGMGAIALSPDSSEPVRPAAASLPAAEPMVGPVAEAALAGGTEMQSSDGRGEAASCEPTEAAPPAEPSSPAGPVVRVNQESVGQLRTETVRLLSEGRFKLASALARDLIEADPRHAFGYLCLGSALQDLGKWKQAVDVYSDCVRHAEQGAVWECRALGGRR